VIWGGIIRLVLVICPILANALLSGACDGDLVGIEGGGGG
jgi:hypothetical protein